MKGDLSDQYSPKAIMLGEQITYHHYCLPFGTYCQVHEEEGPRNSMVAWTQGAISLGPSKNRQGGQLFYSLNSTYVIMRHSWDVIPMPSAVIDCINALGKDQPSLLTFYDRHRIEISDADADAHVADTTTYKILGVLSVDAPITGVDAEEPNVAEETNPETLTPLHDDVHIKPPHPISIEPHHTSDTPHQDEIVAAPTKCANEPLPLQDTTNVPVSKLAAEGTSPSQSTRA